MCNKIKKEIYLVPYSHLDTQWRWEYPTTINKYLRNTITENIDMYEKYPDHRFNFTGALRYRMMQEYFPGLFKKVESLIDEGRWHLAGTCLDETDALVPSAESTVRNILYGHLWQLETFGRSSRDYMIPDCFGFPENLPTVLKHCGINGLSSNKLTWQSAAGIPFEIGKWEGPDGSELICAFNPCRYDSHLVLPIFLNPGRLRRLKRLGRKNNVWKSFQYYGVGDIGGAPKKGSVRRALASIRHYQKKDGDMTVKQGAADKFFDELTHQEISSLDTYKGDLLLTRHSAGILSSAAIMKRWNRKNEQMAFAAEAAAVQAWRTAGAPYPSEKIKNAWYRTIGSQMHDILPGTSTPNAYEFANNDEALAMNGFTAVLEDSAKALAPYVPGQGSILLFNPYEGKRSEYIDIPYDLPHDYKNFHMEDSLGRKYPVQLNSTEAGSVLTFRPTLEAFEWSRFEIIGGSLKPEKPISCTLTEGIYHLENESYGISISETGKIISIIDRKRSRGILKSPMAYEFQKERPITFPAWNMDWRDRKKKPFIRIDDNGKTELIEDGVLRKTLRITYVLNDSTFIKDISLGAGDDMVRFTERIKWRESGCSLKLKIQTDMVNPNFTYNWETSRITRDINNKKQFEMPSRLWMDVSEGDFGFSLIEDSKFGYDRPDYDTVRMTLLFTPALRSFNGFRDQKSQDWGEHTIRYAIKSHDGSWHDTDDAARKFNQPVRSFIVNGNSGKLGKTPWSLKPNESQFGIMSIKKAESQEAVIIRLYERTGKSGNATITLSEHIDQVWEVNGIEEFVRKLEPRDNDITVPVKGSGIISLMFKFRNSPIADIVEQKTVELPMNSVLFSSNEEPGEGILPKELAPDSITDGPVTFNLKADENLNALACDGELLDINPGYNRLSLSGGAYEEKTVIFKWLDVNRQLIKEEEAIIPALRGFIGQWDTRIWKRNPMHMHRQKRDYLWLNRCTGIKPGYIKRNRIMWYSTHTHEDGRDMAYQYGYLFNISFDIPKGAVFLKLPEEPSVKLAAATMWKTDVKIRSNQFLNDKYDY